MCSIHCFPLHLTQCSSGGGVLEVHERVADGQTPVQRREHVPQQQQVAVEDEEVEELRLQVPSHQGQPVGQEDDPVDAEEQSHQAVEQTEGLEDVTRLAPERGLNRNQRDQSDRAQQAERVGGQGTQEKDVLLLQDRRLQDQLVLLLLLIKQRHVHESNPRNGLKTGIIFSVMVPMAAAAKEESKKEKTPLPVLMFLQFQLLDVSELNKIRHSLDFEALE